MKVYVFKKKIQALFGLHELMCVFYKSSDMRSIPAAIGSS